jgi:hypothetical protein
MTDENAKFKHGDPVYLISRDSGKNLGEGTFYREQNLMVVHPGGACTMIQKGHDPFFKVEAK